MKAEIDEVGNLKIEAETPLECLHLKRGLIKILVVKELTYESSDHKLQYA